MDNQCKEIELSDPPLFHNISHPQKRALLSALSFCGLLSEACRLSHVERRNHYFWMEKDPQYAEAFEYAKQMAADVAEDEIFRRGFHGFEHPVIYEGQITGNYKQYSDTCAIFYLKGARPQKYRDNFEGLPNGGKVQINFINFNHDPAQLHAEKVSTTILGQNGERNQESRQSLASQSWEGQDGPQFRNFTDVP